MSERHTKFYFTQDTAQKVLADLQEYADDPSVKIKIKHAGGDHWFIQVCTDTWGGGENNEAVICPGRPGC